MAIAEGRFPVRRSSKSPGSSENALLTSLARAFLLFNIPVVIMVRRALPNEPRAQANEVTVSYSD
jgi:hypothetical protein